MVFPGVNREGHRGIALRLESVAGAATCTALPALGGIDARLIFFGQARNHVCAHASCQLRERMRPVLMMPAIE